MEDLGVAVIRFRNGATIVMDNGGAGFVPRDAMGVHLMGTKGGTTLWPYGVAGEKEGRVVDQVPSVEASSQFYHFAGCALHNIFGDPDACRDLPLCRNENRSADGRRPVKVKLCGTTSVADGLLAERYGADYVGVVVEVPYSERSVGVDEARTIVAALRTPVVILTSHRPLEWVAETVSTTGAFAVQLLGDESPEEVASLRRRIGAEVWKSLFLDVDAPPVDVETLRRRMRDFAAAGANKLLLDAVAVVEGRRRFGGTGRTINWELARELVATAPLPTFLSGGITPENVADAVRRVRPFGVDLCSGVESRRGRRDERRTALLFDRLRVWE